MEAGRREGFADGEAAGAPPVFGMLFGPADLRSGERLMFFGSGGEEAAGMVEDEGTSAAGADVNAEDRDKASWDVEGRGTSYKTKIEKRNSKSETEFEAEPY